MWGRKKSPVLEEAGLRLRLPKRADFAAWQNVRSASRPFLTPFEPKWHDYELTRNSFVKRVKTSADRAGNNTEISLFIFTLEKEKNRVKETFVGGVTLSNIRYGAAYHANIGYWLGEEQTGKGYMNQAVALIMPFAFGELKLRRIHAACLPENDKSKNVLIKNGFQKEGFAPKYLQINGEMRDHLLFGITKDQFATIKRESSKSL